MARDPYITEDQLGSRISVKKLRAAYDDNNDGANDDDTIVGLCRDASSKVDSYLAPLNILPLDPANIPYEVIRLSLDVAVAFACQRHPEVFRQDWMTLLKQAEKDLESLREGRTSLGGGGAPVATSGASRVSDAEGSLVVNSDQRITNDLGDF